MSQERRSSKRPQAAKVEEYDDDQDAVKAGTAVHAHTDSRPASRPPPPAQERRQRQQPEVAPDPSRAPVAAAVRTVNNKKPVIHRHDSAQSQLPASKVCAKCDHPGCRAARNPERRYTLPRDQQPPSSPQHHYPPPHAQYPPSPAQYPQQPSYYPPPPTQQPYQYAQPMAPQRVPILAAGPRRQSLSSASPRPASYHAGVPLAAPYPQQHGPPPSPSAYQRSPASYYPPNPYYPAQPTGYLASTPPNQGMVGYPVQSPVMQTSPTYPTAAPLLMSARAPIDPDLSGYTSSTAPARRMLVRTSSARLPPSRPLPGSFPDHETDSEDYLETGSEYSEDEGLVRNTRRLSLAEKERNRRTRADRERMPPPTVARRPSTNKRHSTAPAIVPRASHREPARERLERAPYSDTDLDLYPPSDHFDSDRTARAVLSGRPGRTNSTYSGQSRRQSLSTSATAFSDQTPETSYSSGSGSRRIVEDRHGRQREYLSRDDQVRYDQVQKEIFRNKIEEDRARDRLFKQRDTAAMVEEYQRKAAAGVVVDNYKELSAESINQATARQLRRTSGSHISHHSRKSSGSTKTGAVRISSGGTEVHVYGDANVTVEASEDGNGTRLIIGNSDKAYHGGSRGSKTDRSRGGSEVHTRPIQEEDGYEKGY